MFVYKNNSTNNYLKINLEGEKSNTFAVGSVVEIYTNNQILRQELIPSRGFQSSIDYEMTFGLGKVGRVDSIKIIWPNKKVQLIGSTNVNQTLNPSIEQANDDFKKQKTIQSKLYFSEVNTNLKAHKEDAYVDFDYEGLIPKMLSKEGPAIAIGDVDNDGIDDVFIGGAFNQEGQLYIQNKTGELTPSNFISEAVFEDTFAVFIDVDNDNDLDLVVGSGGNFKQARTGVRIYTNNGDGNFDEYKIIARINANVSSIAPYDFDDDGDIDLFIASLSVPGIYGINPENMLLEPHCSR